MPAVTDALEEASRPSQAIHRTTVRILASVSIGTSAIILLVVGGRFLSGQPADLGAGIFVAFILLVGIVVAIGVAMFGWRYKAAYLALIPLATVGLSIGVVVNTSNLHWWLSSDDFERFADGSEAVDCPPAGDCRLGWWRIEGAERLGPLAVVWIPDGFCYAGYGLAHAGGANIDMGQVREIVIEADLRSGIVSIRKWRDNWWEICLTT